MTMDKEQFSKNLAILYNRSLLDIVKKKHGNNPEITFGELCELIFQYPTSKISDILHMSPKTLRKGLVNAFPDIATGNKGTVWRVELLSKLGYKKCCSCSVDKVLDDFYTNNSSIDSKSSVCKECSKELNKIQRKERPEIIKASNSKRKAIIKGASIAGADLELIKRIYKNCPEDYHVDHIIPLAKGGQHHESNLCYLPAKLNLQKQDKLPEEVPEIMLYAIYPELN